MKLRTLALAAAIAAISGQAMAVTTAQATGATNVVYIAGSSAATGILSGLVSGQCQTGTFTTFSDSTGNYNVYSCQVNATNDWNLAAGTVVVVNKRDAGGSAYGVYPVATNTPTSFLDLTTCPDNAANAAAVTCTGLVSHTADAGVSDLNPTIFNAAANTPTPFTGQTVTTSQFGKITTVFSQVFGVAVTKALYNDLQAVQVAAGTIPAGGVPSLSRDYLANLFSSKVGAIGWKPLNLTNSGYNVNLCYRDQGSGTRAAGNFIFGQYPGNTNYKFSAFNDTSYPAGVSISSGSGATATDFAVNGADANGNTTWVAENVSGGDVKTCLNNVNSAGGYGIGLININSVSGTAGYQYVNLDGGTPSRDLAKVGQYGFWVESTMQTNKTFSGSAAAKTFLANFITKASASTNLALLSGSNQLGVFALPLSTSTVAADSCATYAGTYPTATVGYAGPADEFCSRFTRGGSDVALPSFIK